MHALGASKTTRKTSAVTRINRASTLTASNMLQVLSVRTGPNGCSWPYALELNVASTNMKYEITTIQKVIAKTAKYGSADSNY